MKAEIEQGRFFIVSGQKAYVAEKGEITITDQGRTDARLRVIFDNGTQSNMLMRSLQRALKVCNALSNLHFLKVRPLSTFLLFPLPPVGKFEKSRELRGPGGMLF